MNAEEIKSMRKTLELTQDRLADRLGVHRITVVRWERGDTSPSGLALKALERLAKRATKKG